MTARRAAIVVLAALLFIGATGSSVTAQPAPPAQAELDGAAPAQAPAAGPSSDTPRTGSKAQALLFWLFALMCIGGSLFVITRRNLVTATMGLVGTFFAIAAVYVMLYAHFIAAIQVLVYAGAIMVLFVFVVMILNREEDEPWALQGLFGKGVAALAMLYLFVRVGKVLWDVKDTPAASIASLPTSNAFAYGTTEALGMSLFRHYLFPFEAVSILLLIAVVGALAVARPHEPQVTTESQP